ncbi:MAG TPA: STAS domain-containing protein [Pseudonocardiaceae bacterium]|nr:STAS domain-containing protein [Pseudonocardiaceae bacterium]
MNESSDAPAGSSLRVAEHGPETRVITVVGQIDTPTARELANSLTSQLAAARIVVVDLNGVSFLGSAGLSALFEANELASQQRRALRLVCNSPIANWVLAATGLHEHFVFADTVPAAVKTPPRKLARTAVTIPRRTHRTRRPRPAVWMQTAVSGRS